MAEYLSPDRADHHGGRNDRRDRRGVAFNATAPPES